MVFEMLRWWYTTGWMQVLTRVKTWTLGVERAFSFFILAQTLFAPWRRIITSGGRSLDEKMRALFDNFVSRCVGFVVRSGVLIAALLAMAGTALAATVLAIAWPLLPLVTVYGAVRGITG